jgi:hypothetical protein
VFVAAGLVFTWLAVRGDARLGTAGAPFLGAYQLRLVPGTVLAPAVAAVGLALAARRRLDRLPWPAVSAVGCLALFAWAVALALVDGAAGLTRGLTTEDNRLIDVDDVGGDPLRYLRTFAAHASLQALATRGHPPGPALLLWGLQRLGVTNHVALGLLVTAVAALLAPLVLSAVRGVCGEDEARRFLPVLTLAPYAVWLAGGMDAVVATLGAAMVAAGVRASDHRRTGLRAAGWAMTSGVLLGVAAMFSYAVPWLGLSVVCLYFARRRAALNVLTGIGVLLPVAGVELLGFGWVDGLSAAHADFAVRIGPHRSAVWWAGISLVALALAAGPPLYASLRKTRNTPGWPFLVGAGAAVLFSVAAGFARGGVEDAWLTFFPWLTVAAVAPQRQAGPPVPTPLLLVGVGAATAVVIEAVLATAR